MDYCSSTWITMRARSMSLHSNMSNQLADNWTAHFLWRKIIILKIGLFSKRTFFSNTNYPHCNSMHHGSIYTNNSHTLRYRIMGSLYWWVLDSGHLPGMAVMVATDSMILSSHFSKNCHHLWMQKRMRMNQRRDFILEKQFS